jgi:hypothetical protein
MALVTCPTCGIATGDTLAECSACKDAVPAWSGMVVADRPHLQARTPRMPRLDEPEIDQSTRQWEANSATRSMSEEIWTDRATRSAADGPPASPEEHTAGRRESLTRAPDLAAGVRHSAPPRWRIARHSAALSAAVAAIGLTLLMVLPGEPYTGLGTVHRTPVATHVPPTATPAAPALTPQPGFAPYTDSAANFRIEYPAAWKMWPQNPGVLFEDNDQTINYVVQVLVADPSTVSSQTDDATSAANWVDFALSNLQQRWGADNFQRFTGPTPSVIIGGQSWRTGIALIGVQQSQLRVQVYATVRGGKPYIITVMAADAAFSTGQATYFKPMLSTFEFLPPSAS